MFRSVTSVLTVSSATTDAAGTYTCTATVGANSAASSAAVQVFGES